MHQEYAARVSHIMPALNLALNADFEKKELKKHYLVLFEHYLHFCKQERLKALTNEKLKLAG